MLRIFVLCLFGLGLTACATTPKEPVKNPDISTHFPDPDVENPGVIIIAEPRPDPEPAPEILAPPPPSYDPPEIEMLETPRWFEALDTWKKVDHRPALKSFRRSCQRWAKADPATFLNPNLPEYGTYGDWISACQNAEAVGRRKSHARKFFEAEFEPISITTHSEETGLLTGYYEPEIEVRKVPDDVYFEPVLAKPEYKATQQLPRSELTARSARVIAYGKPIEVFFMQIQGSGRIKFKNGRHLRAAYDANNGRQYKSIGKVLVDRGEMTVEQASKQAISDWMEKAGPERARALMNENPRYIFFVEQAIANDEGPRGAMRVPLTEMGSMAVDPRYHPYGALVWLSTKLPQKGGDFKGRQESLLVSVQDTGNAIRGPLRGDLFFGSGDKAGNKAGVMKHRAAWTILVPKHLIPNSNPIS